MSAAEDDDYQEPTNEDPESEDINRGDYSMLPGMSIAASPRLIFIVIGRPFLQAMTEEEAYLYPTVDHWDPRNHVPRSLHEIAAIQDALQVTIDHYKDIFGYEPVQHEGGNYVTEYCNIQHQMDEFFGVDATALRRLGPWLGSVFDVSSLSSHHSAFHHALGARTLLLLLGHAF